ncbi:hypothetical protein PoB_005139800 [Plakobranchus ocellatus]|uniref:Uncharacterized protein n=1 Tax=Plakobranchus ocellatus TaxID=259542 RepID=A0AAV4BZ18_9GAST|nr:hypothetical protein PoB_005139800 [Plakobranchus ocellatus]
MLSTAFANHSHKSRSTPVVWSQDNTMSKSRSRSALIVDIPDLVSTGSVSPNTTGRPVMELVQIQNLIARKEAHILRKKPPSYVCRAGKKLRHAGD